MEINSSKRRKLDHPAAPGYGTPRKAQHAAAQNGGQNSTINSIYSAGVYGPSSFVLQVDELLKEAKLDLPKSFNGADEFLHQLKEAIEAIEPHAAMPIAEAAAKFEKAHRVTIPFPDPKPAKDSPYKLMFEKPSQLNVVGSYISKTMVKSQRGLVIDMVVQMPETMFQDKDFLNLRYFYKRAYYLAKLAVGIRSSVGADAELSFDSWNSNPLLPTLLVRRVPNKKAAGNNGEDAESTKSRKVGNRDWFVRVIPCAPDALFPRAKLRATANSLRPAESEGKKEPLPPTPFYNSTLKAESTNLAYLRFLRQAEKSCPAFRDACVLGRIWLQQTGFNGSIPGGGFGNFEWSVLVALLLQGGGRKGAPLLSSSLKSTQIFKAVVYFLASVNFPQKPLVLGPPDEVDSLRESGPVIFDSARQLNILYKMSPWSAASLQHRAKVTHTLLNNSLIDQFNPVFIAKADLPLLEYDLLVSVSMPQESAGGTSVDRRDDVWEFSDKMYRTLRKGLGDRAALVHIHGSQAHPWSLSAKHSSKENQLCVGILFNPENMARQVDHGPSVEDKKEAVKFRSFWGDKSDLRRFKDGSILETLIWTQGSAVDLCEEIAEYVLQRHCGVGSDDLSFYGKGYEQMVPLRTSDMPVFTAAKEAYRTLERDLRDLEALPLQIRHIAPVSSELRFSSTKAPIQGAAKQIVRPMDVILDFEASGKWPESLPAIQRAKVAFLLKIGSMLEEFKSEITTHMGLEDYRQQEENLAFLDIVYNDGIAFRLRIHCDLEETLLDQLVKNKTLEPHIRLESADLLTKVKHTYKTLPLHTQTITTFCTRFPALSASIRLTKHWFSSHKLSCHFTDELVELLVLKVFLEPYPWTAPSSGMTGFLRTLQFLSKWDWRVEPLIVDFSGTISASDRSSMDAKLDAWRKSDPNMNVGLVNTVLFVATSNEMTGSAFTNRRPSKVVATRMTSLARSASKLVKAQGVELDPKSLFSAALSDYDVVIHLSNKAIRGLVREDSEKRSLFKNLDERTGKAPVPVANDATAILLDRLREAFSAPLLLFHGGKEDRVIGGLWNPQIRARSFRAQLPCSFQPVRKGDDAIEVNKDGILAEIARIGGDLIERIGVKD